MTQDSHALDPAAIDAFYQVAGARRESGKASCPTRSATTC